MTDPRLIGTIEAARLAGVPTRQIYTWIEEGRLRVHRPPETEHAAVEEAQLLEVAAEHARPT